MIGPEVYEQFVGRQLDYEYARRTSLDQRGIAVVGSSATLTTVLFGLQAFVLERRSQYLTEPTAVLLALAAAFFVGAAGMGLLSARLIPYRVLNSNALERLRHDHWNDSAKDALSLITYAHIGTLGDLRAGNARKSSYLRAALLLQILAALMLTLILITVMVDWAS